MTQTLQQLTTNKLFDGWQYRYQHSSEALWCDMTVSVYLPPQAQHQRCPVLWWLSGLTCTDENFVIKAGAQRMAAELGIILVAPDTSPRGNKVPDDPEGAWDFGSGAGFYLNATQSPWLTHYQMYDYIVQELPELLIAALPIDGDRQAISGHSMGGHGALTIAFKNPQRFQSISAFAPICAPNQCPWGQKAFSWYLGENKETWKQYDACELIQQVDTQRPILIDQGTADNFLEEQLKPELLEQAAQRVNYPIQLNRREGYDHSYFFISTFIESHLRFHALALGI